jgi:DNA-binding CsgD family transcriptional regulator
LRRFAEAVRLGARQDGPMDGDYRVGDADRAGALARLETHCVQGRLSLDDLLDRSAAARAAVTRADLAAVLRDLPDETGPDVAAPVPPAAAGWRDRGWRTHVAVYALTTGGVIGLWELTRDPDPAPQDYGVDYWWPLWFWLAWSVLALLHYLRAAGLLALPGWPTARATQAVPPPPEPPAEAAPPTEAAPPAAPATPAALALLTAREREILALVAEGHGNKEIARRLFISERTARTHVSNILRKLGLPSRTRAALVAVRALDGDARVTGSGENPREPGDATLG